MGMTSFDFAAPGNPSTDSDVASQLNLFPESALSQEKLLPGDSPTKIRPSFPVVSMIEGVVQSVRDVTLALRNRGSFVGDLSVSELCNPVFLHVVSIPWWRLLVAWQTLTQCGPRGKTSKVRSSLPRI